MLAAAVKTAGDVLFRHEVPAVSHPRGDAMHRL
jgi:hypothetical protein